jgi:hypothetical protein
MRPLGIFFLLAVAVAAAAASPPAPMVERIYSLKPSEGVFAYARIAPDGNFLAYASEIPDPQQPRRVTQTVTVVDLKTRTIIFEEPGIDAYWSNDGTRMIFSSFAQHDVSIRHHPGGEITRNVAPQGLGDYYSWSVRDGKNLILTIASNYYNLDGDHAIMPSAHIGACPAIGVGDRPLISHDGRRITTFVRGTIVVRGLTDCEDTFDTGLRGAKADFSFDGKYIAFHVAKAASARSDVVVVDVVKHTLRNVTASLSGSSLFPSWTNDGRLCFRYDGDDYRGFMMATDVLRVPEEPLPAVGHLADNRTWSDVFPETARPAHALNVVMIWGTWSAHSPTALTDLQRAREFFVSRSYDVGVTTAVEPGTFRADADRILRQQAIHLPEIPLTPPHFDRTEARNQVPTTLLFLGNQLIDRKLGPLSFEALTSWITAVVRARGH